MHLAFLHGEQVLIGILLAAAVVFVCFPVLLYIWLWRTKVSELKLAVAFFVSVTVLAVILIVTPDDPTSILTLATFSLSFILTLPWSALASTVLVQILKAGGSGMGENAFAVLMIISAAVNAVILYFIAVKLRRLIELRRR